MDFTQIQQIANDLFTPAQQAALLIITIGVMILTQAFKSIYFGFFPCQGQKKKKAIIWLAAFTIGILGGVASYFVAIPQQPLWFNLFAGVSCGGIAIGLFKLLVEIIWPRLSRKPNV